MFLCKIFLTHFGLKSDPGMYSAKKWSWGTFITGINQTNTSSTNGTALMFTVIQGLRMTSDRMTSAFPLGLQHSLVLIVIRSVWERPSHHVRATEAEPTAKAFPHVYLHVALERPRLTRLPSPHAQSAHTSLAAGPEPSRAPHRHRPLIKTRNSLSLFLSSSFARRKGRWGHFERVSRCWVISPRRFRHRPSDVFDVEFIQLQ